MKELFSRVLKGTLNLGLECRAIKYEQPTTTTTASTSTTTPTTTSTLPTTSQRRDSFEGPIYSPIGDHLTEDPYPICNVPAPGAIEIILMTGGSHWINNDNFDFCCGWRRTHHQTLRIWLQLLMIKFKYSMIEIDQRRLSQIFTWQWFRMIKKGWTALIGLVIVEKWITSNHYQAV